MNDQTDTTSVYGASDDLVELDGRIGPDGPVYSDLALVRNATSVEYEGVRRE